MQSILSFAIFALVAGAAVDSASIAGEKSVVKRDLWHPLPNVHMAAGVQNYGAPTADWGHSGAESRIAVPDHNQGPSAEQYRVQSHPVHEWHQEEEDQSAEHDWHHTVSSHSQEGSKDKHSHVEIHDEGPKHEKKKEQVHHHHHHVKVIEVPKPFTVHVEKHVPIYVEKPFIVEKHVPLKYVIKKKYHHDHHE